MIDAMSLAGSLPVSVSTGDDVASSDVFATLLSGLVASIGPGSVPPVAAPFSESLTSQAAQGQACETPGVPKGPIQFSSDADGNDPLPDTGANPDTDVNAALPVVTGAFSQDPVAPHDVAEVRGSTTSDRHEKPVLPDISVSPNRLSPEKTAPRSGLEIEPDQISVIFDTIAQAGFRPALVGDGGRLSGTGDPGDPRVVHVPQNVASYGISGRTHAALDVSTSEVLAFASATEVEFDLHPSRLGDVNVSIIRDVSGPELRLRLETDQASLVVKHYQGDLVRATDGFVRVQVEVDQGRAKQRRRRDSPVNPETISSTSGAQAAVPVRHA